jgi:dihydropteroate synthase
MAGLEIPHPGLLERPFALLPLLDLWPRWSHPTEAARAETLAEAWRCSPPEKVPSRTRRVAEPLCELVGILNVTPDSFSDGGRFLSPEKAREQAALLYRQGASIVDIGAESTRPGSKPLGPDEEWSRLAPVLEGIGGRFSIDTRHAATAARAIRAGAAWVNDVEGLESPEMRKAVADSSVDLVVMHSLGIPPDASRTLELGRDPVEQLLRWGEERLALLAKEGIPRSRVILDPGIGFGKLAFQSWLALSGARRLHELGTRILIGHSRKSFLSLVTDRPAAERDLESAVLCAELARAGAQYLRIHDPVLCLRAIRAATMLDGVTRW